MQRLVGESKGIVAIREAIQNLVERQRTARRLPPILTRLDLGELALARGDRESAVAYLGEARSEAVHVGLSSLIDRIDGLLRAL